MIGQSFAGYKFPLSVGNLSSGYTLRIPIIQKATIPTLLENIFKNASGSFSGPSAKKNSYGVHNESHVGALPPTANQ